MLFALYLYKHFVGLQQLSRSLMLLVVQSMHQGRVALQQHKASLSTTPVTIISVFAMQSINKPLCQSKPDQRLLESEVRQHVHDLQQKQA